MDQKSNLHPSANFKLDLLAIAHLALLFALTLAIALADIRMIEARGLHSEAAGPIQLANDIYLTGVWPRTAFYPPLVTAIALVVRAAGITTLDPYVFNLVLLGIGLLPAYALARLVLSKPWAAATRSSSPSRSQRVTLS